MISLCEPEIKLKSLLERGAQPSIESIGGIKSLQDNLDQLSHSPIVHEVISVLVDETQKINGQSAFEATALIDELLSRMVDEFAISETIEVLDRANWVEPGLMEKCSEALRSKVSDETLPSMTRAFALDGAMRIGALSEIACFELIPVVLRLGLTDEPELLRRATKVLGALYSFKRDPIFIDRLLELSSLKSLEADAALEIGLAKLGDAFASYDKDTGRNDLVSSKIWFDRAAIAAQDIPESRLYSACLRILTSVTAKFDRPQVVSLFETVKECVFELQALRQMPDQPTWLRYRFIQILHWQDLIAKLICLIERVNEPSWWEPIAAIEQCIVPIYFASRFIFGEHQASAIESMVRPTIESSLLANRGQAFALKQWIAKNNDSAFLPYVKDLSKRVEELSSIKSPTQSVDTQQVVLQGLPEEIAGRLQAVIDDARFVQLENLDHIACKVINDCVSIVEIHPDYADQSTRQLFNTSILGSVRFLSTRLDATKQYSPRFAYLFEPDDGKFSDEDALKIDYMEYMQSQNSGTGIEVSNLAAGRADVLFTYRTSRLVAEIKREQQDASFDSLKAQYLQQTVSYQATNSRIGLLIVLDQSEESRGVVPHLSALVKSVQYHRAGEAVSRMCVIIKVPGRRVTPSSLSK